MPSFKVLVVAPAANAPAALAALQAQGIEATAVLPGANLVPDALQAAPDAVLFEAEQPPGAAFARQLAALQAARGLPVALVCGSIDEATLAAALAAGLHACAFGPPADRAALLALARARFAHEAALREQIEALRRQMDERKLVDRAKGILMRGRAMSEDEAFGVLRAASMQSQSRVGQVSERVVEAARDADAVNRAGQLRMLSQRIVKLAALRLAGIDAADTRERLDASVARAEQQIAALERAVHGGAAQPAHQRVVAAWMALHAALHAALKARPHAEQLGAFDALAETLLREADALARTIEAQGGPSALHVVNLCGRQRMLAQRMAKHALLATLLRSEAASEARAASAETDAEFQRALRALAALPIATPEIRDGLAQAERQWQQLLGALPEAQSSAGRRTLAQVSEALLVLFDELTARYEHSLQVILG